MKKTAWILIVCILSAFCLTACGQSGSVLFTEKASSPEPAATTQRTETTVEVPVSVAASAEEIAARNAEGDEGMSFGDFGYVQFGYFPQTIAEKDALKQMSQTTDETGFYFCAYDGAHYARVLTSEVYGEKYEFTNERKIERRTTYYFKVEPIKWRVFAQIGRTGNLVQVYLVCDVVLDSTPFLNSADYEESSNMEYYHKDQQTEILANNWAYSALRKWMNGEFYQKAFSAKEKAQLIARNVAEVTEIYPADDAEDDVFALTLDQVRQMPASYLMAQTTDYARCRGTFMSVYKKWYGNGRYWLSDAGANSYSAAFVSDYQYVLVNTDDADKTVSTKGESVGAEYMGIRPVISIAVENLADILLQEEEE